MTDRVIFEEFDIITSNEFDPTYYQVVIVNPYLGGDGGQKIIANNLVSKTLKNLPSITVGAAASTIGFFGVTPVVQQLNANWTVLANVVTALKNLGLIADSP